MNLSALLLFLSVPSKTAGKFFKRKTQDLREVERWTLTRKPRIWLNGTMFITNWSN